MTREFGATAWGRAWLRMIEPVFITGPPDRDLPRARALARRAVEDLTVEGSRVTARLTERGHRHTITLNIPIWNHKEQRAAAHAIGQATPVDSGDLPDHLVTELTSAGVQIAPRIDDINVKSDTDEVIRRHVLAICYALVQRIDEEPILASRLRTSPQTTGESKGHTPDGLLPLAAINPRTFYLRAVRQGGTQPLAGPLVRLTSG
ncbi:hypothetical protein [Serinicoccus kebangsaanensis]|uniref:hypothetical protein n=1 Tax=Serinicoccus kebangsaanensis TaxID=2602069 RepID=UPI00124D1ED4|nr:hypothetical protein [Serinicoccus kebangsaanensis]